MDAGHCPAFATDRVDRPPKMPFQPEPFPNELWRKNGKIPL